MNIGLDIDDTLTNSHENRLAYGQKFDYEKLSGKNLINPYGRDTIEIFNWSEKNDFRLWFEEGLYEAEKNYPPRPFAKQVINDLWQDGHKIFIISSRNKVWFHEPYEESKEWLEKNEIKYDQLFVEVEDKAKLCKELDIDVFMDDEPLKCLEVANVGVKTFIYDNIFNKDFRDVRIKHIYTWIQFYHEIKNKLKNKK